MRGISGLQTHNNNKYSNNNNNTFYLYSIAL